MAFNVDSSRTRGEPDLSPAGLSVPMSHMFGLRGFKARINCTWTGRSEFRQIRPSFLRSDAVTGRLDGKPKATTGLEYVICSRVCIPPFVALLQYTYSINKFVHLHLRQRHGLTVSQ